MEAVRYKARIVAKGFTQIKGIDLQEIFAPVSKYETLLFLTSFVAQHDYEIDGIDVLTAFLNGK